MEFENRSSPTNENQGIKQNINFVVWFDFEKCVLELNSLVVSFLFLVTEFEHQGFVYAF